MRGLARWVAEAALLACLSLVASTPAIGAWAQTAPPPAAPSAQEPDPARLEAARAALAAPGVGERIIEGALELALPALREMIEADPAFREEWREPFLDAIAAEYRANRAGMVDTLARVYARNFTVQELRDFGAFLRTAGGRALFERQVIVMGEASQVGAVFGQTLVPGITQRFEQTLRERGLPLPADADDGTRQRL